MTPVSDTPVTLAPQIMFWLLTLLVLGGAAATVVQKNLIGAVMSLVASFFGLAGLYLMLSAQFLGAIQVLVYAGAIMTLFVFVVMVLNREESDAFPRRGLFTKGVGVLALGYLVYKTGRYLFSQVPAHVEAPPADWGGVADVGSALFTTYLFPFEAISFALLVAVIAAVVVARTPKKTHEQEAADYDEHAGGLAPHHAAVVEQSRDSHAAVAHSVPKGH